MSTRLFEQSENNNPSLTKKIAFGGASVVTENMTFTNFLVWLYGKLGFLKVTENLNDLNDKPTARTNLGVYSIGEADDLLDLKAPLYPEVGGALGTNNTVTFTPTANYNPATKKYIDDQLIDTGWVNCINTLSKPTFTIKARQIGKVVNICGDMTTNVNAGDTMFEIPSSVAAPTLKWGIVMYAAGGDYLNLECLAASKEVKVVSESGTSAVTSLNITYFV